MRVDGLASRTPPLARRMILHAIGTVLRATRTLPLAIRRDDLASRERRIASRSTTPSPYWERAGVRAYEEG
jgi:hypothetical protein